MGYDVHITRSGDPNRDSGSAITLQEWLDYVRTDPEMRLDGFAEVTTPQGPTLRYESPGLAVWTAYELDGIPWFDFREDCIVVKNPDAKILKKMNQIAEKLNARVIGAEGKSCDQASDENSEVLMIRKTAELNWFSIAFPAACSLCFTVCGIWIIWVVITSAIANHDRASGAAIFSLFGLAFLYFGIRNIQYLLHIMKTHPESKIKILAWIIFSAIVFYVKIFWL